MIKVNSVIYDILSNDDEVRRLVGNDIYPVAIPGVSDGAPADQVRFPVVVMTRTAIAPQAIKPTCGQDITSVQIDVYDTDYDRALDIAQAVRNALDGKRGTFANLSVSFIRMNGASEGYTGTAFAQSLTFTIKN